MKYTQHEAAAKIINHYGTQHQIESEVHNDP